MFVTFTGLEHRFLYRVLEHSCCPLSQLKQTFCSLKLPLLGSPCVTNWCSTIPQFSLGTQHLFNNDQKFFVFCGTRKYTASFPITLYLYRATSIHFTFSHSFSLRYTFITLPPIPSSSSSLFFPLYTVRLNFMCISYFF